MTHFRELWLTYNEGTYYCTVNSVTSSIARMQKHRNTFLNWPNIYCDTSPKECGLCYLWRCLIKCPLAFVGPLFVYWTFASLSIKITWHPPVPFGPSVFWLYPCHRRHRAASGRMGLEPGSLPLKTQVCRNRWGRARGRRPSGAWSWTWSFQRCT